MADQINSSGPESKEDGPSKVQTKQKPSYVWKYSKHDDMLPIINFVEGV